MGFVFVGPLGAAFLAGTSMDDEGPRIPMWHRSAAAEKDAGPTAPPLFELILSPSEPLADRRAPEGIRPMPSPVSGLMDPGVFDWYFGVADDFPFSDDADTFDIYAGFRVDANSRLNVQWRAFTIIPRGLRTDMMTATLTQDASRNLSLTAGVVTMGNLGMQGLQNAVHGAFRLGPRFRLSYPDSSTSPLIGIDLHASPADGVLVSVSVMSAPRLFTEIRGTLGVGGSVTERTYLSLQAGYEHEELPEPIVRIALASGPFLGARIIFGSWGLGIDAYPVTDAPSLDTLAKILARTQIRMSIFFGGRNEN